MWGIVLAAEARFFFYLLSALHRSAPTLQTQLHLITVSPWVPMSTSPDRYYVYMCMSPCLNEHKSVLQSVWPRQQYRALLIAMLISFTITDRLCVCRSADCWVKGEWMEDDFSGCRLDSGRVEQTGFILCYWSAVNDLSLCFPFLKHMSMGPLWFYIKTLIAPESTGCLSSSDGGKNFQTGYAESAYVCGAINTMLPSAWGLMSVDSAWKVYVVKYHLRKESLR